MKKKKTQLLGIVLSAAMLATSVPAPVYAEPTDNVAEEENNGAVVAQEPTEDAENSDAADKVTPEDEQTQEETPTAQVEEGEKNITVEDGYTVSIPSINFQGANAAVAEAIAKDVEIDEKDPVIKSLRGALEDLELEGGEAGIEGDISTIAQYAAEEKKNALSEDQINTVVGMYQQYLNQWKDNAEYLGVQNPFFLDFNDEKDGLGIMGEMLALDGASVDDVRNGKYSYDDLTGMIMNFMYGDKLGIQYYGKDVTSARDSVLDAISKSGAKTTAQKLLVINDWLAHENTFDMSYIMNSGKKDEDKPMIAKNPQKQEHEQDVYNAVYSEYEKQIKQNFHDQIFAGIENNLLQQFYEKAIQNIVYQQALGKDESAATDEEKKAAQEQAEGFVQQNKDAIDADPDGFVREKFNAEVADQLKTQADAFIKDAEENGVEVQPGTKMTVEQLTQNSMANDKIVDLDGDGTNDTTANDAVPIYAKQAAEGLTTGILNYWEGTQFGALGFGTSVCLGYSKAYTYLVQCMDKNIYLKDANAGYTSSNWKTSKDLYYDADGKIDTNAGYTVDLVRISFQSEVTMFGHTEDNFASDHYWNAVKVDGKWYYVDPCYTDVYTEVMSRDRVETDGDMSHAFFMFSHSSSESLYNGNYSEIRSLYKDTANDQTYEKAWMARAASNVYSDGTYMYYLYDSTDLFSRASGSMSTQQKSAEYKLVRHKITDSDGGEGDSDYETLIDFTAKDNEDDTDTYVKVRNKDGELVKDKALTKLYAQFKDEQSVYPSIGLTAALYNGILYFNVSNDIMSYDPATGKVATVKEYNTVSAVRDETKLFGGMAFSTVANGTDGALTVENHPIAGLTIKSDGTMVVSIATNFAFISGKTSMTDHNSYGYEFEETDYNPNYTNYKKYASIMGDQKNDNDEFMWSANFVDKVDMKKLAGSSHDYKEVTVPAFCGRNEFTEERCSDCGLIKEGTRNEKKDTAHEHHYIKFHEVYYTKSNDTANEADNYVCPECGACITEPVKSKFEQANTTYEKRKAIWDAAQKNAAEGHAYSVEDAEWSEDNATVTFQTLKCESCANKVDKLDCLLSSDTNETNKANIDSIQKKLADKVTVETKVVERTGACTDGIVTLYKAEGKTADGYKYKISRSVKGEAGKHAYDDVKFNWDAAAIKDDDGNITGYKTDQKEGTSVTVDEVKCSVCGEVQKNVSVSVVKDTDAYKAPTCEEAGKDVYVATVTSTDDNTVLAKETKEVAIAKLGHKYGDPVWSDWEEKDGKWTTTATFTCANDATHVQTPEVKIDSETVEKATYTKEGKVVYTASVTSPDGKKVVNPTTKEVVVEKERLAAVENLKASSSVGKVKLTWSKVKDAEGYLIYGIRGGGNKYGYIGMTSKTSFVDVKALTSDYNYYWVFAYCKDENDKMYPGLTAHYVYGKAQKCAAVTDLKASSVKGGVKLTWTKSAGAEGYLVYGIHPGEKYGYIGMTTKGTTFTDKKASSTDWNFYWVFPYHTDSNGNKVVGGTPKYVYGKAK